MELSLETIHQLEGHFDDRYVLQSDCNEKQENVNKKFANDDKRIELLVQRAKTWDKLLKIITSASVGALIAEIANLIF